MSDPVLFGSRGALPDWLEGGTKETKLKYISTRHHTWHHRFTKWFKWATRLVKRILRNRWVWRIALFVLRKFVLDDLPSIGDHE